MRLPAVVLNALLVITMGVLLVAKGVPRGDDLWLVAVAIAAPLSSLLVLLTTSKHDDWLSLYVRRKALEERRRIDELEKERK